MNNIIKGIKYIFDKILDLIKFIIDSSKLTIKKLKILLFLAYMAFFSFNYCIDFKSEKGNTTFTFDPQNVPPSIIITTAVLIAFLIIVDIIDNNLKMNKLINLIKSSEIPLDIKHKAIDELIKLK